MLYLGIDPGNSAGFALITGESTVLTVACKDNIGDAYDFLRIIARDKKEIRIGLEDVHSIWGSNATSNFGLAINKGKWIGILQFLGLPFLPITVRDWQKYCTVAPTKPVTKGLPAKEVRKLRRLHKDNLKLESLRAALAAFPGVKIENHDVADAINIARYVRYLHTK